MFDPLIDHCTLWLDRITVFGRTFDWSICCYEHDMSFEQMDLLSSGYRLMVCVNHVLPGMGVVMFIGVISPIAIILYARSRRASQKTDLEKNQ